MINPIDESTLSVLNEVPGWCSLDWSQEDWNQIIQAATVLQSLEPHAARTHLLALLHDRRDREDCQANKILVLLRVTFDTSRPRNRHYVPRSEHWMRYGAHALISSDPSYPLEWSTDGPRLREEPFLRAWSRRPDQDYDAYNTWFPKRDLTPYIQRS